MTAPIHPSAGVNRDSVDVNTESYTTFVIYDMFSLNSRGKLALFRFYPVLDYSRHFITQFFLQLLLSNKLRCSVPLKSKVFELSIVQLYCSMMITAA